MEFVCCKWFVVGRSVKKSFLRTDQIVKIVYELVGCGSQVVGWKTKNRRNNAPRVSNCLLSSN